VAEAVEKGLGLHPNVGTLVRTSEALTSTTLPMAQADISLRSCGIATAPFSIDERVTGLELRAVGQLLARAAR
jgi:hypothetical protein